MIPLTQGDGKALYIPKESRASAYEPKKKRKPCSCGAKAHWVWQDKTKHHWTPEEPICSRCLVDVKLADQTERVENFLRKAIVSASGHPERLQKLAQTVNVTDDPPTLNEKGYWNLAHVVVITSKAGLRTPPPRRAS